MARFATRMGLVFLVATACIAISAHSSAGQAAPAPAPDCNNELLQLLPCLGFLTNSSVSTVGPFCCQALTNVSVSSPSCLCLLISPAFANQTAQFNINDTRALQLPGLCSLNLSPSSCTAILGPSTAPAPLATVLAPAPAPISELPAPAPSPFVSLAPAEAPIAGAPVEAPVESPVQSPDSLAAPGPAVDCNAELTSLSGCLNFLSGTATAPSDGCCNSLGSVVSTAPQCLCTLATSPVVSTVNATLVQELPGLCHVSASLSDCSGVGAPLALPNGSEAPGGSPSNHGTKSAALSSVYMLTFLSVAAFAHALLQ